MLLAVSTLPDTHAVAAAIAGACRAGDIIVLSGEMGAGKTAFAKGFGAALGVTDPITSPTFTLVQSYDVPGSRLTLHHADIYRLDTHGDVAELALNELAEFDGIVLVEWGDVAAAQFGDHLHIHLAHRDDEDADDADEFGLSAPREIEVSASGTAWANRWERLTQTLQGFAC